MFPFGDVMMHLRVKYCAEMMIPWIYIVISVLISPEYLIRYYTKTSHRRSEDKVNGRLIYFDEGPNPCGLVIPHNVVELGHSWSRYLLDGCLSPSHYLNHGCNSVNCTLGNKFKLFWVKWTFQLQCLKGRVQPVDMVPEAIIPERLVWYSQADVYVHKRDLGRFIETNGIFV